VAVADSIDEWVRSPELVELVEHFDGSVPDGPLAAVLDELAEFSAVWDFRGGVRERFDTTRSDYPPEVDGRLRQLIGVLGLGGRERPVLDAYDHMVVLGGGVRVAIGRCEYAARLIAGGARVRTLAGLGSLRWRHDREQREGVRLGLAAFETEADMMVVGLRRSLGLGEPTSSREGDGWWHRAWAGRRPEVHVLAAASSRPPRRANTADSLIGWAEQVGAPARGDRVLLVTNHPYVRHQHCDAVRLLGGGYGCGIETVGFDELARREWGRPLATTELLQEVRSSILATRGLYRETSSLKRSTA
jgi:hypothetical protein